MTNVKLGKHASWNSSVALHVLGGQEVTAAGPEADLML